VLVVEDEPTVRRVAQRTLEAAGFSVVVAADGGEALRVLEARGAPVDALVADVVMPHMSGRELVERVRALGLAPATLLMSGYTDDELIRRGALPPATLFLEKPFTGEQLVARLREALAAHAPAPRDAAR
jgi:CheY-like chemotaxis protein